MNQALSGIRVLDFTQLEQGPAGTQVLADFGAEVIKVERPLEGEIGRRQYPTMGDYSPHWSATNRNKKSITVDLKTPEGIAIIHRLAKDADVVTSNFRPGVMERLGLGPETLHEINPNLIVAFASGYGQSGPYRDRRGQDLAAQAMSGLMSLTGHADGPPTPSGTFIIDYIASQQFAMGILLALHARERLGRGQVVDTCLLNAAVASHLQEGASYLNTGLQFPRPEHGVAHAHNTALYGYYQTLDGRWIVVIGEFYISEPWQRMCRALSLSAEVAGDLRFSTIEGLRSNVAETRDIVAAGMKQYGREEAIRRLEAEDILVTAVLEYAEVFADPQVQHNDMVISSTIDGVGDVKFVGNPIKLSETPGHLRLNPPRLGEHNTEILAGIGIKDEELAGLQAAGIVGSESLIEQDTGKQHW